MDRVETNSIVILGCSRIFPSCTYDWAEQNSTTRSNSLDVIVQTQVQLTQVDGYSKVSNGRKVRTIACVEREGENVQVERGQPERDDLMCFVLSSIVLEEERGATFYSSRHRSLCFYLLPKNEFKGTYIMSKKCGH